jgi:hypothetical protein
MVGITERNRQKDELASIGFSLKYIDEWQPKTTLYRHKPSYTVSGEIAADVGTAVAGVPGSPDYVLRKSKDGLFAWPPSGTCECKWCIETRASNVGPIVTDSVDEVTVPDKEVPVIQGNFPCDECDYLGKGPNSLRMHVINRHPN